jgi:hypothetical protein
LPDNLVQGRIDQDPSVPSGQLGGCQDVGALNNVWLRERDRLLDHLLPEGLPPGIQLWISHPVEPWFLRKHLPKVWIVIESMQWQLHLVRQRLCQRRLPSTACPCDKNMLLSTALHLALLLWNCCRTTV